VATKTEDLVWERSDSHQ